MKIEAINTANAWFSAVSSRITPELGLDVFKNQKVINQVEMESIYICFEGEELGHKPFAMLIGQLRSTIPAQELPYGITELIWPNDSSATMAYRYDFTDAQIAQLVTKKGLYRRDFSIPDRLLAEWTLDGEADVFLVSPMDADEVPAAFVEIIDATTGKLSASSGYDLVAFLPDVAPEVVAEAEVTPEHDAITIDDALSMDLDIDKDIDKDVDSQFDAVSTEVAEEKYASSFAELMEAAAKKRKLRELALRQEVERIRGDNVSRNIEEVTEELVADVENAAQADIDNSEEEELMAAVENIAEQVEQEAESTTDAFDGFLSEEDKQEQDRDLRASAQAVVDDSMFIDDDDAIVLDTEMN